MWFNELPETPSHLAVLTPVLPAKSSFLTEAATSITEAREAVRDAGWTFEWILVGDGPGELPEEAVRVADLVVSLPQHVGISAARNCALARARNGWIMPLDGDDLIDSEGVSALLRDDVLGQVGWVTTNRVLIDGTKTAYWREDSAWWHKGQLNEEWVYPLPFHPNDFIARRDVYLAGGGWPAIEGAEATAFSVLVAGITAGASTTHVTTRYRTWDGQTVADPAFLVARELAYETVGAILNARRRMERLPEVTVPLPGAAVPGLAPLEKKNSQ